MTRRPAGIRLLAVRQPLDEQTVEELAAEEARALGVSLDCAWVDDLAGLGAAVQDASVADETLIVLAAPGTPDLARLAEIGERRVMRLDVALREPDLSAGLVTHIQGRGAWGVVWAVRAAHHRRRRALHTVSYGEGREQYGELRLPAELPGVAPVVVLLHGGFWRSCWQLDLMDALSIDLADRGVATWNVEYRRPDRHGWAATEEDVRRAVQHLDALADRWPVDVDRVAVVGHSAGGSMAVQVAAQGIGRRPNVRLVVQLAGLVDLVGTHRRDIGNGAVERALGGTPGDLPRVYARASPLEAIPSGVRQVVVVGRSDGPDLREMSRRYVRAARTAHDDVELIEDDGDHFSVIDPGSVIWQRAAEALLRRLIA